MTVKSHSVSHAQINEYTHGAKWCTILLGSVTLAKSLKNLPHTHIQGVTMCQGGYLMLAFHFSKHLDDHGALREKP